VYASARRRKLAPFSRFVKLAKVFVLSSGKVDHCNTLQHTATHRNTSQHIATHRNTLQHTATHCNTLQHALQHTPQHVDVYALARRRQVFVLIQSVCTLQHTATRTATHTATRRRVFVLIQSVCTL